MQVFRKIEVYGFKSFADRLEVDFSGGITCIVGPNGCGKSNVSDAIRWVLGEQSSKMLRGTQMQDVIFKGTEARKPMGYCEVSLYFDNSQKTFPIEYDELVLTRKLFKSGESEYFVNKKLARLKDITNLLHDSGIDRDGLTIISQGQVSEIITSRPETRRGIFEEAAGIAKFKSTKVDAERKLEKTTVELTRVRDVINEIEKNLAPLLKQAENAIKYMALRDELKNLEINLYITQYDNAATDKERVRIELARIDDLIKEKQADIVNFNTKILRLNTNLNELDRENDTLRERVLDMSVGLEREKSNKRFEVFEQIGLLKQERAGLLSKKRTIENLIESGEGYKFAVRKLLETKNPHIVGVVAQELVVPQELEAAIEVALGAAAQNVITYNEAGAQSLIEYLRRQNFGRATFFPITSAKPKLLTTEEQSKMVGNRAVLGVAAELVEFNPEIRPVVDALLGRTVVVDNLDNAIELARDMRYSAKIVTIDGDVIETRGSITGGSKNALNNNLWHNNNLAMIKTSLDDVEAEIAKLEGEININEMAGNQQIESMTKLDAVRTDIDAIAEKKDAVRQNIANIEAEKAQLAEDVATLTHTYYRMEATLQRIDVNLETMQIRIDEEYGMNYSAAHMYLTENNVAPLENEKIDETTARVSALKRQINALGPVNLDAIEQSKSARERFEDYSTQVADLEKAKADLEKIIHDLSLEMKTKFTEAFDAINKNFGHVFKELFGGGHAKLELVPITIDGKEKVDPLQSGIDIIAEPPGKKLANLTLLSGGEKAMTAIAILFAILKLRPMPFCLLDEIEAALDEANVSRFANYLLNFSKSTQFIVITHRKPTMELADNLYGVTMEEKGVSKLVSVKLENWATDATTGEIAIDLPAETIGA